MNQFETIQKLYICNESIQYVLYNIWIDSCE